MKLEKIMNYLEENGYKKYNTNEVELDYLSTYFFDYYKNYNTNVYLVLIIEYYLDNANYSLVYNDFTLDNLVSIN